MWDTESKSGSVDNVVINELSKGHHQKCIAVVGQALVEQHRVWYYSGKRRWSYTTNTLNVCALQE